MWRNYWTVAVRALAKSKTYSIINIAGLAIGMAACILILLYVRYENSYDKWLPDADNTYQFQAWYPNPKSGIPLFGQMSAYVTGDRIKKDFPQVERVGFLLSGQPIIMKDGQSSFGDDYGTTDADLLKVIKLPMLSGGTLATAGTAVLSQTEAIKQFGTDQVIGRTLSTVAKGKARDYKIVGVFKDIPKNSHLKLNAILRADFNSYFADSPDFMTSWGWQSGWVYLNLRPGTDPKQLEAALPAWEKRNIPDETNNGIRTNQGDDQEWHFVNVKDIHLGKAQNAAMTPGNDKRTVATFSVIALLILGMAIVNFTNLATARAGQRAREVALRKVLGANRKQLVIQFVGEALLISAVSMLVALALVELLVRPFAAFLDAGITLRYFGSDGILLPAIGVTVLVGVLSGLYPAFFISRFKPSDVLKANRSAAETPGGPPPDCAGHRAIRSVDRAHRLHRGGLCANRLRAHSRSWIQARLHPAGRQHGPRADAVALGNDYGANEARARRGGGRAYRYRHRHRQQHQQRRRRPRRHQNDRHWRLPRRPGLFRCHGADTESGPLVRQPADGRPDRSLSVGSGVREGPRGARH
ncbi:ABC transporter permease [Sphingomonas sp. URHD0057]|uniref:ABC transporter permease n=1 Tax=Sphingomonas sp. URHD0057 TaxID=1380389 RepID=UPI000A5660B6|nr:ABC transporter permease [Sphingomonas sp. URHD0057]